MHIFLTGASTGIGSAIAHEFDKHFKGDAFFSLVSRKKELLDGVAQKLQSKSAVYVADLSEPAVAEMAFERAVKEHGEVDILVNNAGMSHIDHFTAIKNEESDKLLKLNYVTPARLMRKVIPSMIQKNSGIIINVASVAGITPTPYLAEYSASKAALASLTVALAGEYKDSKIHFLTVYPGPIETPMSDYADSRYEKGAMKNVPFGTAKELAKEIRMAMEKKKHKVVYPAVYKTAEMFRDFAIWATAQIAPKPK